MYVLMTPYPSHEAAGGTPREAFGHDSSDMFAVMPSLAMPCIPFPRALARVIGRVDIHSVMDIEYRV